MPKYHILKTLAIVLALSLGGCATVKERYTPWGCNVNPVECKLCEPGQKWIPPGGCWSPPQDPTPPPSPTPQETPRPQPTMTPTQASPIPTPAPSATPEVGVPVPTPLPTGEPTPPPCEAAPPPPSHPVSLAQPLVGGRCPKWYEPLGFQGDRAFTLKAPPSHGWCGIISEERGHEGFNASTAHKLGEGIARIGGITLELVNGRWLQKQEIGCTDAYGRLFPDCENLYNTEIPPDFERNPYTAGGYSLPFTCVPPGPVGCAPVEEVLHHMAPGQSCHAWDIMENGQVKCLIDSTIRPICDLAHLENWNGECGKRTHDPDFNVLSGAMDWKIIFGGVFDRFNPSNFAQAWIHGDQGARVRVEIRIPQGHRTPDGCLITPRNGDGFGFREFNLPTRGQE